MVYIDTIHE